MKRFCQSASFLARYEKPGYSVLRGYLLIFIYVSIVSSLVHTLVLLDFICRHYYSFTVFRSFQCQIMSFAPQSSKSREQTW